MRIRRNPDDMVLIREVDRFIGGKLYSMKEFAYGRTGIEFVLIPGGIFRKRDEGRGTRIDPFYMAKYEITNQQYFDVFSGLPIDAYDVDDDGKPYSRFYGYGPKHPVTFLAYYDAQRFCDKLDLELPTKLQREYACRAGTAGRNYWHGANPHHYEWFDYVDTQYEIKGDVFGAHEVGWLQPNDFGLHDTMGNVREWCRETTKYRDDGPVYCYAGGHSYGTHYNEYINCADVTPLVGIDTRFYDIGFRPVKEYTWKKIPKENQVNLYLDWEASE